MGSKIEELEARGYKGYNSEGQQMQDPNPVRMPVGFTKVDNFANRVREIVRGERLKAEALAAGAETFEEADDFDIPDDPLEPGSQFEADFDVPTPAELRAQAKAEAKERARKDALERLDKGTRKSEVIKGDSEGDKGRKDSA